MAGDYTMSRRRTRVRHQGNVIDLAVGVVIGAAFGKIVSTFVDDITMPPLDILAGNGLLRIFPHAFAPEAGRRGDAELRIVH